MAKKRKKTRKKSAPRFNHIFVEIYNSNIYWVRCTRERYTTLIYKVFDADTPEIGNFKATAEGYHKDGVIIDVIWLNSKIPIDSSIIAHESLHIAYNILKRIGLCMSDSSEEAYAYLMQHIMIGILKSLKK